MRPDLGTLQETSATGAEEAVVQGKPGDLCTFGGVFTPSLLTILGVIMYLRFGRVVGNAGLMGAFLLVTISTGITFLTALSIAAIATDQRVRIGGAYSVNSCSLGLEIEGAVGLPLYIAQGLSVALYTVGFAESVVSAFPTLQTLSVLGLSGIQVVGLVITILGGHSRARLAEYCDPGAVLHPRLSAADERGVAGVDVRLNVVAENVDEAEERRSTLGPIVFLGMATPDEEDDYVSYYTRLQKRNEGLPPTVFVLAAEDISLFRACKPQVAPVRRPGAVPFGDRDLLQPRAEGGA